MKRLLASCLLVISIVALSGLTPATGAPPRCQVAAARVGELVGAQKSCSIFLPNGGRVNVIIIGVGSFAAQGGTYYSLGCPSTASTCYGAPFHVAPGTRVTIYMSIGVGRLSSGLP